MNQKQTKRHYTKCPECDYEFFTRKIGQDYYSKAQCPQCGSRFEVDTE